MPPPQAHHRLVRTFEFDQQKQTEFSLCFGLLLWKQCSCFWYNGPWSREMSQKEGKGTIFFPFPLEWLGLFECGKNQNLGFKLGKIWFEDNLDIPSGT